MKKTTRLTPGVESLDSLVLLSGAAAHVHVGAIPIAEVAPAAKAATSVDVHLRGLIKGTGTISETSVSIKGSGNLGKVGATTLNLNATSTDSPTVITLKTAKGKIFLSSASDPITSGTTGSGTYTVTGGTKAYANATGSGTVTASYALTSLSKFSFKLRFG